MRKVTISAPGKLMLFGEHAVVYGEPCLVTAVDSRLQVTVAPSENEQVIIETPESKDTRFVEAAIQVFNARMLNLSSPTLIGDPGSNSLDSRLRGNDKGVRGIKISTISPFSGKFGFGSSSAVTVATLKALSAYFDTPVSSKELFDLSFQVISQVQGVGSGFDVAAASFGGTLYFKKGGVAIEPMSVDWKNIALVIGYSGVKSNTVDLVKQVARLREQDKQNFDRLMRSIGIVVTEAKVALLHKNWIRLGELMNVNQEYLRKLGVSTEILEQPIHAALKAGAFGAKLSGAGGGDCMIALVDLPHKTAVEHAITQAGGTIIPVSIHALGVYEELISSKFTNLLHPAFAQI